jgi:Cu/Ag efflux protein CusF
MKTVVLAILAIVLAAAAGSAWAVDMKDMDSHAGSVPMESPAGQVHHAVGTVKRVDAAKGSVTISHGPVTSLNWPAMTMTFGVKDKSLLNQLAAGKNVAVDFVVEGSNYTIVKVSGS